MTPNRRRIADAAFLFYLVLMTLSLLSLPLPSRILNRSVVIGEVDRGESSRCAARVDVALRLRLWSISGPVFLEEIRQADADPL